MTDFSPIIEMLEKADGPDRELNIAIFRLLHPEYDDYVEGRGGLVHPNDGSDMRVLSDIRWPNYTASRDASIDLLERKLPGHGRMHSKGRLSVDEPLFGVKLYEHELCVGEDPHETAEAEHDHEPIAILLAMFRALQAQETASND